MILALTAICALGFGAVGCGDDDSTTASSTTSTSGDTTLGENAPASVDEAVASCNDEAQQLGGAAGTALSGACTAVGDSAKQAISAGGEDAAQALSKAAESCKENVAQLPSGQAQDVLTQLCEAVGAAA
jgi:hypothetical protein